jgi:hypothetical protein
MTPDTLVYKLTLVLILLGQPPVLSSAVGITLQAPPKLERAPKWGSGEVPGHSASRLGMIPGAVTVFKFPGPGHRPGPAFTSPTSRNKLTIILTSTELGVGWEWM